MAGATESTVAYVASLGVASAAELTFMQKLKLTTIALKEKTLAWMKSPLGVATLVAAGIFAIYKGLEYLATGYERATEKHEELKDSYAETTSDVETLESELEAANEQLDALVNSDTPELVDPEEIEKLRNSVALLEKQLEYKQKLAEIEKLDVAKSASEILNTRSMNLTGNVITLYDGTQIAEFASEPILDEYERKQILQSLLQTEGDWLTLIVPHIGVLVEQLFSYCAIFVKIQTKMPPFRTTFCAKVAGAQGLELP